MEGITTIKNDVLLKIAIGAAREVSGVDRVGASSVGRTIAQAFGGGRTSSSGVGVKPGKPGSGEASFGMTIATQYSFSIPEVADEIRKQVSMRVKELTGLSVARLDIHVDDIREAGGNGTGSLMAMIGRGEERRSDGEEDKAEVTERRGEYMEIP